MELNNIFSPSSIDVKLDASSIESGYFIFTLMPSLYCHLRCPHCYLSLEERQDKTILSPEMIEIACKKIDEYWDSRNIQNRTVICYWYGGEPTSMGVGLFTEMADKINSVFKADKGYTVKHTVLTSLVSVRKDWFDIFRTYGGGHFQTSYDGDMRGGSYVKKWERKVQEAVSQNLQVTTISVVNSEILSQGPIHTFNYLANLGVMETSWLPFMWNEQNSNGSYDQYAPSMNKWSEFMIALTEYWLSQKEIGRTMPEIGQLRFILSQSSTTGLANIAGQTLFLMPNGDFVLPDYQNGWKEFMQPFGNILDQSFGEVITSKERKKYLRRQATRNYNEECLSCNHYDKCVMEFWKENRPGDDCFGGKKYVEWVVENNSRITAIIGTHDKTVLY